MAEKALAKSTLPEVTAIKQLSEGADGELLKINGQNVSEVMDELNDILNHFDLIGISKTLP